jgi:hypothetical protein
LAHDLSNIVKSNDAKMNGKISTCQKLRRRTSGQWLLGCVCLWLACVGLATAEDSPAAMEYQVKAAYLYNFTKFIDWPSNNFTSADAPIVIGIMGENPFGKTLDDLVKGEVVRGHPLIIKRLNPGEDWRGCQVLFISHFEKDQLASLLQQLKGNPVLTVSDSSGFAEQGGIINFVIIQGKVKLEINPDAATAAGLQISSKLLRLAHIVKSG